MGTVFLSGEIQFDGVCRPPNNLRLDLLCVLKKSIGVRQYEEKEPIAAQATIREITSETPG
jgi:hypothetical protein